MHLSRINYLNTLLALIPISFIAGNLIINLNIVLVIISTIFIYNKKLFKIKLFFFDKLLILFFLLIILTGLVNELELLDFRKKNNMDLYPSFIKSLFFLRYLFFYFCLRFLCEKEDINLKFFLLLHFVVLSSFLLIFFINIFLDTIFSDLNKRESEN